MRIENKQKIMYNKEVPVIKSKKEKCLLTPKYDATSKDLKRWLEFILNPRSEKVKMNLKEDKTLNQAYDMLEDISNDEYLREIEELKWKAIRDEKCMLEGATEEGKKIKV